jgi:hypothetical protein
MPYTFNPFTGALDKTGGSSSSVATSPDIVVATSGGDYTSIQDALDNLSSGGGTIFVKAGTYTITTGLLLKVSNTRLILSGGATVQCNGATVTTLIKPNATNLSRMEIRGGKWLQTNATAQGVCFDMSDCPNSIVAPIRIEEFGTAIKVTDTTSTSFYSHFLNIQIFNCNNGIEISGSQANFNLWEGIRIRPKAGGAGTGISLVDARGNTFINCNSEPATGTGITGINIDATSRDNQFLGCWVENNAIGINIESGANNNSFFGGSITSNSTDITDAGTNTTFIGVNRTGTKLYSLPQLIVNDAGVDVDTRIEGDNDENIVYVDAGNDRVGIGTNAPDQKLHVVGNYLIEDATASKGYRFRTSGNDLDFDFAAKDMYFSGYTGADFTGTQKVYLVFGGEFDFVNARGNWEWKNRTSGAVVHQLNPEGGVVFNEDGGDRDIRIEGDTDTNLFFTDASTDRVGIGTNTPLSKFETAGSRGVKVSSITNAASPYTAANEEVILCDATSGAITVNLPDAIAGRIYTIKKTDASVNTVTIDGDGADTIDGVATKVLVYQNDSVTVVSNGTNWFIL